MLAHKGEDIVCSQGHKLGSITEDIVEGRPITGHELRIDFSVAGISPTNDGHSCRACNEKVTEVRDGTYRVRTTHGWVGELS